MSTPLVVPSSLPELFFTDELPRKYPAIFMYAVAGAGKTNALRTLRALNPLTIATEIGNTKGMSTLGDLHMPVIPIDTLEQLIAITAELAARAKPGQLLYRTHGPFGALALDSLTGIGVMLEDAAKKLKGWDMIWDNAPGARKDPRSAYPYIAEKGRQVVTKLMKLPVPLVLTCREQLVTEGEDQNAKTYPAPELPGQKLPRELPGWPEATVRMRVVNGQRVFVTETEGDVVARIRLKEGVRCPKYIKPDLGALIDLLQGDDTALKALTVDMTRPLTEQQKAAMARNAPPVVVK